jgi:hypothetical protein
VGKKGPAWSAGLFLTADNMSNGWANQALQNRVAEKLFLVTLATYSFDTIATAFSWFLKLGTA